MAKIELIGDGERCDFSVADTLVSVGNLTVDCGDYQEDSAVCIDICRDGDEFVLGAQAGRSYVMSIVIPPRTYHEVQEGVDENGNPVWRRVADEMDPAHLVLRLWPYSR